MGYGWHDFIGNVGVVLIITTYLLLQVGKMQSRQVAYSLINAIGAVFVIVSLYYDFNLSSFIIEIFWLAISSIGIVRFVKQSR